jgi:hypothetical protein
MDKNVLNHSDDYSSFGSRDGGIGFNVTSSGSEFYVDIHYKKELGKRCSFKVKFGRLNKNFINKVFRPLIMKIRPYDYDSALQALVHAHKVCRKARSQYMINKKKEIKHKRTCNDFIV